MVPLGEWPSVPIIPAESGCPQHSPFPPLPQASSCSASPTDTVHKELSDWPPSSVSAALASRLPRPSLSRSVLPLLDLAADLTVHAPLWISFPPADVLLSRFWTLPLSHLSLPTQCLFWPCILCCSFPEHHLFSCLPTFACTVLCLQWLPSLPHTTPMCLSRWRSGILSDTRGFSSQAPTIKSWRDWA